MHRPKQRTTRLTRPTPTLPTLTAGPHAARSPYRIVRMSPHFTARLPGSPQFPYRPVRPTMETD